MLTGDSVPEYLEPALESAAASRGWRVVSAAHGACPVTGEISIEHDGLPDIARDQCPVVPGLQNELIAQDHPNIVVWWDRFSLSTYHGPDGKPVIEGTPAFWRARDVTLRAAVDRLTSGGAKVVFVAVEPPGKGIWTRCTPERCPGFIRFQIDHYADVTQAWNATLKRYAQQHPDQAAFVSITSAVCKTDVSPCDDTFDGAPARPDGTHYAGPAEAMVAALLLRDLVPYVGASTQPTG